MSIVYGKPGWWITKLKYVTHWNLLLFTATGFRWWAVLLWTCSHLTCKPWLGKQSYHSYVCLNTSYTLSTLALMQHHRLYTVTPFKLTYTYLAREISQLQNTQTGSGAHQASCSVGNRFPFRVLSGQGMKMIPHLHRARVTDN